MAVDDRYKRAAATAMLLPSMYTTHTDTSSGVDDEERWSVAWAYSGIPIGAAVVAVTGIRQQRGFLLGVY